jgi:hypothetical protein
MLLYGLHHSWIGLNLRRFWQMVVSSNSDRTDFIAAFISCRMVSFNSDRNAQMMDLIFAWTDLISSRMACVFSCILASICSCLAFVLARMASVYASILAFIISSRFSWCAFLSASLFSWSNFRSAIIFSALAFLSAFFLSQLSAQQSSSPSRLFFQSPFFLDQLSA